MDFNQDFIDAMKNAEYEKTEYRADRSDEIREALRLNVSKNYTCRKVDAGTRYKCYCGLGDEKDETIIFFHDTFVDMALRIIRNFQASVHFVNIFNLVQKQIYEKKS